ncbi:Nitrate transporter [compost metagenome]
MVVIAGSLLRPLGGWLADRFGGYRLLVVLLGGVAVCIGAVGALPPVTVAVAILFVAMGLLGMGNGAVFQLVPQRFPDRIGIVTGVVGAAGGLGGFFLPSALGALREVSGTYAPGLFTCAAIFAGGTCVLLELGARWSQRWDGRAVQRAGVYSYRAALSGAGTDRGRAV